MLLRTLADTNVLISALLGDGVAASIFDAAHRNVFSLWITDELLAELQEALSRPKFARSLATARLTVDEAVSKVAAVASLARPSRIAGVTVRDPDDLLVLEAALGAGADIIVTRDRDLLTLRTFRGIAIMNPGTCADTLGLPRR